MTEVQPAGPHCRKQPWDEKRRPRRLRLQAPSRCHRRKICRLKRNYAACPVRLGHTAPPAPGRCANRARGETGGVQGQNCSIEEIRARARGLQDASRCVRVYACKKHAWVHPHSRGGGEAAFRHGSRHHPPDGPASAIVFPPHLRSELIWSLSRGFLPIGAIAREVGFSEKKYFLFLGPKKLALRWRVRERYGRGLGSLAP
jgi:hypothetical protein